MASMGGAGAGSTRASAAAARPATISPAGVPAWPEALMPKDGSAAGQAWRHKQRRLVIGKDGQRVWSVGQFIVGGVAAWSTLLLGFLVWWRPHLGLAGGATGLGLLSGVLYSWLYYGNVKAKQQRQQVLSMDPGLKGCQYMLGSLPSWISLTEREKMEWLNRLLGEVWPYYDRGICTLVKEVVEPIIEQYRPPIFKRIFFQELTFGEAPVRIEGIAVKDADDEIDLEVDVRWCGDANISLGIDLPVGGEFTRLTPKVRDIVFVATIKVVLKPLVEKIPGFAAAAVALKSPPIIKYRLDFGVLPGGVTQIVTAPVLAFVNFIVQEVIVGMLLWPKRVTVPILSWNGVLPANDDDVDLEVERLNGRQRGVVRVHVVQAKELKSYDTLTGKSDPFVEVFTTNDHRAATRVVSNSLAPVWDETKYLPVLEKDTVLRLECFDHDAVNIKDGPLGFLGGKEFMGRAAVKLQQFIAEEGLEDEFWLPLGKGDWTNLGGPGRGEGWVKLGLQYRAVENIAGEEVAQAARGLLLVGVIRCHNLDRASSSKAKVASYVTVKVGGLKEVKANRKTLHKTPVIRAEPSPRWASDNKFTLYDVDVRETLTVSVMEPALAADGELGRVEVPVADVVASRQVSRWTKGEQAGYVYRAFPVGGSGATVELELEFLPYW